MINDTYGSFLKIGLGQTGAEQLVDRLMEAYAEPHRAYHNMTHILGTIYAITSYSHLAERPEEIEVALWFHDSIYDTHRDDNEAKSAVWAEEVLTAERVEPAITERISKMIRATAGHVAVNDPDIALMLDIDISILGTRPAEFEIYDQQIRREYWWVPEDDFNFLRAQVLRQFLTRDVIYLTEPFRDREKQARENLERKAKELEDAILS